MTDDLAAQMVREILRESKLGPIGYSQRAEAIARRYMEKAVADKQTVINLAKQELREIYSGDEGPVLLRTVQAKCARRHEAGEALERLIRAERAGKDRPMSDEIKALVEQIQVQVQSAHSFADRPLYNGLETGFRHTPLTQTEREQRYQEACRFAAQDSQEALRLIAELRAALTAQADEIERLRARLEITDEITERYDGIACRDETIRLLEQKIAALKAAQEVKA